MGSLNASNVFPSVNTYPDWSGIYIPEIYSKKLLVKFYAATVFGAIANTDYEGEVKSMGDTIRIRTVPDITIRDYVIDDGLTAENPVPGSIDLLIDKGKYFNVKINDVNLLQSDLAYVDKWAADAAQQMKITIDRGILADIYTDSHANNRGVAAGRISGNVNLGVTGTPVELHKNNIVDKIAELSMVLDEQNVPDEGRWLVLPAWAIMRIKTSELKDASLTGDGKSTLRNGRVGMIDRFTIYMSNQVHHDDVGSPATREFFALAGQKNALSFCSQLIKTETLRNPNDFGDLMRGLQVYGYKVLKPEAMCTLVCTPTTPA